MTDPSEFDPFTETPNTLRQAVACLDVIDLLEGRAMSDGTTLEDLVAAGRVPVHVTTRAARRKVASEIAKRMGPNLRTLNEVRGREPTVAEKIARRKARRARRRARRRGDT